MLFNSVNYIYFLLSVFTLFQITPKKNRYLFLLISSYIFLLFESPTSAIVLTCSGTLTYLFSLRIYNSKNRTQVLFFSVTTLLSILAYFKYRFFIMENIDNITGLSDDTKKIHDLIIPLGISFYTFQMIAYLTDIYRGVIAPEKRLLRFALFVNFFPQLIAGPIERARDLLPKIPGKSGLSKLRLSYSLNLIVYGLFKKVVIADRVAPYVDKVFSDPSQYGRVSLLIGALMYSLQIYCDFSGYTSIARGSAGLFGIKLSRNFNFPYLSQSLSEFWLRWHITLSSWIRDYIFFPILFNGRIKVKIYQALILTFSLSGLWHGANWTFVLWGFLWGALLSAEGFIKQTSWLQYENSIWSFFKTIFIFVLIVMMWTIFRSENIEKLVHFYSTLIFPVYTNSALSLEFPNIDAWIIGVFSLIYVSIGLLRNKPYYPIILKRPSLTLSLLILFIQIQLVLGLGIFTGTSFIYFKF